MARLEEVPTVRLVADQTALLEAAPIAPSVEIPTAPLAVPAVLAETQTGTQTLTAPRHREAPAPTHPQPRPRKPVPDRTRRKHRPRSLPAAGKAPEGKYLAEARSWAWPAPAKTTHFTSTTTSTNTTSGSLYTILPPTVADSSPRLTSQICRALEISWDNLARTGSPEVRAQTTVPSASRMEPATAVEWETAAPADLAMAVSTAASATIPAGGIPSRNRNRNRIRSNRSSLNPT